MNELMRKEVFVSAADTPNIDSAGSTSEFVFGLPFVVTKVGVIVTTAVNPDNAVAMTLAMSRRPTIGSASGEVSLDVFQVMAANAANLAVGTVVYKDLHIDDSDGEQPEDYNANTSRAKRFEAPNSNLTTGVTDQSPFLIPPSQSFALTLETNAEADSGAVRSFVEGFYMPLTSKVLLSTASLNKDVTDQA